MLFLMPVMGKEDDDAVLLKTFCSHAEQVEKE
jgi:hypothetical protein